MKFADFFRKKASGDVAKELVLVSDRANCSPDIMEQIQKDIINVLSKYVEIDQSGLDIKIEQNESEGNNAIFANIPILSIKQTK